MEYQVTVDQFTGPLDLLLHLIKEHDMDLLDLDVAAVCDQYLAYIQTMDPSLLEAVSEYLVMAAWLIEMKSKLLLPKPEIDKIIDKKKAQLDGHVENLNAFKKEIEDTATSKLNKTFSEDAVEYAKTSVNQMLADYEEENNRIADLKKKLAVLKK